MRGTGDSRTGTWLAMLLCLPLLAACGDDDGPTGPSTGVIRVIVDTSGGAATPSYTIRIDGTTERSVEADGSIVLGDITPGEHQVLLLSVPTSCTVFGGSSRTVTVVANEVAQVDYDVTCTDDGEDPKPDPDPPTEE